MIRPLRQTIFAKYGESQSPEVQLCSGSAQARVSYRFSDDLLFGSLNIAEHASDAHSEAGALQLATEIAYQEIFDVLNETEHRHLIRIWNYLPRDQRAGRRR